MTTVDKLAEAKLGPAGAAPTPKGIGSEGQAPETPQGQGPDKSEVAQYKYKIKVGDEDRELTPEQIAGTFERYRDLNYKHAQLKPVIDLAEALAKKSNQDPATVAKFMIEKMRGGAAAPEAAAPAPQEDDTDDEALTKWEQENAASLPPGYKNIHKGMKSVAEGQAQLMNMLQQVMQSSKGVADAAAMAQQDAKAQSIASIKRNIGSNLAAAQQKLGLPDESGKDFLMFAAERGYSMEDFVDQGLAMRVATDFKNTLNSPDFERLKNIASRRQAFTGSIGTSPGAGGGGGPDKPVDPIFDRLAKKVGR